MARKKKFETVVEQPSTEKVSNDFTDGVVSLEDFDSYNYMNKPEEVVEDKAEEITKKDTKSDGQRQLKKVIKFTPIGPKVEFI